MTRNDPAGEGRDLAAMLHAAADDAARTPRRRPLDAMAATARTHGLAARRRRTAARSLVAAASVGVVAAGGVLVAQNLGDEPLTPPPASSGAPEGCGLPFAAPAGTVDGLDLVLAEGEPPLTADGLDALPAVVPLLSEGASEDALTLGSTGYVTYTVVSDGVVVATGGAMPEPWVTTELVAGGDPGPVLSRTTPQACAGGALPAGDYEVWAQLAATEVVADGTAEPRQVPVVGGPWTVTIGDAVPEEARFSLACNAPTSEITSSTFAGGDEVILEVMGPDGALDGAATHPTVVRADPYFADGSTLVLGGDAVETYLLRDETVVSRAVTPHADGPWWVTATPPDGGSEDYLADGLRADVSGTSCRDGELLEEGVYTLLVIVRTTVPESDRTVDLVSLREDVTVGDGPSLPSADPDADFPRCGALVPGYQGDPFEIVGTVPGDAAVTIPYDEIFEGVWFTPATFTNTSDGTTYLGNLANPLTGVLVRDGRVVGTVVDLDDLGAVVDVDHVELAPGGSVSRTVHTQLSGCEGDGTLPGGRYEVWAWADLTVKEVVGDGPAVSSNETVHVVSRLATVELAGHDVAPTSTLPTCSAPVPSTDLEGASVLELTSPLHRATVGLEVAHNGDLAFLNGGATTLEGTLPGVLVGVLVQDGHIVGKTSEVVQNTPTTYTVAAGATGDAPWVVDLRSCTTGEHVGAGTYDVWVGETFTTEDGTELSLTGRVATLTVDPERVTD